MKRTQGTSPRVSAGRRQSARGWHGYTIAIVVWMVALGNISCGKEPAGEIERARAALEKARGSDAERYAPQPFLAALDTLGLAEEELQEQKNRFAMARRYGHAKKLFVAAERAARRATDEALTNRQQAGGDAQSLLESLRSKVLEIDRMLESPAGDRLLHGSTTGLAMESLQSELGQIRGTLENVEAAISEGRNQQAVQMAAAARDQIEAIHSDVTTAIRTGNVPVAGPK